MAGSTLAHQFGENVQRRRAALGWTLEDLAERAGLSKTGLWQVEKGRSMPGIDTALKLARALDIPVGTLIVGAAPARPNRDAVLIRKIEELYRLTHPDG